MTTDIKPSEPMAGYKAPAEHIQKLTELQQKNAQNIMDAAQASGPMSQEMIQDAMKNMDWGKTIRETNMPQQQPDNIIPLDDFDKVLIENIGLKEQNLKLVEENGKIKLALEKNGFQNLLVTKYKIDIQKHNILIDAKKGHITLEPRNANNM